MFFLIRPFLTALSSSLCAFERLFALGSATKAFTAPLISFLIPTLRSRRFAVNNWHLIPSFRLLFTIQHRLYIILKEKASISNNLLTFHCDYANIEL